ncbi:integrase core domain-containing protein [Aidingimonas lacisalsi]|uniref:integrase core domain-containing protein n=1 Tax=Aidingimonas lacisalsi TaxID=2604086 RepID=UPI0038B30385
MIYGKFAPLALSVDFESGWRDHVATSKGATSADQASVTHIFYAALKEVCIWLNRFESLGQARAVINHWIRCYKGERPHQSLGC